MEYVGTTSLHVGSWFILIFLTTLAFKVWSLFVTLWWKPLRFKRLFEAQGLRGMPYRFFYGNTNEIAAMVEQACSSTMPQVSHDIAPRFLPYYFLWTQKLGKPCFYWFGSQPRVLVPEPELAREILSNKFGHYLKPKERPEVRDLIGKGLASLEGEKWAQHRRIFNPAFFMENLKAMIPTMAACTDSMLNDWVTQIEKEASGRKEIDVHVEFKNVTADIIAHAIFGSSYAEGKQVMHMQHEQLILWEEIFNTVYIPWLRFVPTRRNRYRWKLENQIEKIMRHLIFSRMDQVDPYKSDLLGLMMNANRKDLPGNEKKLSMNVGEMVDECKTFFFGGHETTSTLLTWTLLLLGTSIEWQEKAREEVMRVCGKGNPSQESIHNLKTVGMILNEASRLYPAGPAFFREASKDVRLGKELVVPQGTILQMPHIAYHHDPAYWGHDAHLFNPDRFANGISKAGNNPFAFMPFGFGPHNCIGQNFALIEAKVVVALILQRFAFHVSPSYTHAPSIVVTIQPKFGMQIVFEMLSPLNSH